MRRQVGEAHHEDDRAVELRQGRPWMPVEPESASCAVTSVTEVA